MAEIDYDSYIIQHDPLNAYSFTGMDTIEQAFEFMYKYCKTDFQHSVILTRNENGEGSRVDANTVWLVFTNETLPKNQFQKLTLSADGIKKRNDIRAAIAAAKKATEDTLAADAARAAANNQSSNTSS